MNDVEWRALPHGKLEMLAENLWRVQGSLQGIPMQRVMTIARTRDGRLVLHSPVALEPEAMGELEALGDPAAILVPSRYHRLDAPRFARRYPAARVFTPRGSRAAVEKVVRVDGVYEDFDGDESVRLEHLDGVADLEGVVRVRSAEGTTLVFNDVLFNMPHDSILLRLIGSSGGPRVTRIARTFIVKDKRALARRFIALANGTPDLARILVSHHEVIAREPAEVLRGVALTL
jgi:hypothetical protein